VVQGKGVSGWTLRPGWSPSYRKSYLAAIKFLYRHFLAEEDLPDHNPAALETSPKIVVKRGYTPTRAEVKKLLEAPGSPRARLLVHWMFYAPSRRATFATLAGPTSTWRRAPGRSSARATSQMSSS
jgi:integrase